MDIDRGLTPGNQLPHLGSGYCALGRDVLEKSGFSCGTADAFRDDMRRDAAYRKLDTWQAAMDFVEQCYNTTRGFPREELHGLTSQFRRAAVSIPSNIAEGYCRRNTKVYLNHVAISLGSHGELETYIELCRRLGFITEMERNALDRLAEDVGRMLTALHRSLEEKVRREEGGTKSSVP